MTSFHRRIVLGAIAFVLCVCGSTAAFGQPSWELGLKGGVSVTKLTGDDTRTAVAISDPIPATLSGDVADTKLGFVGGGYATVHVTGQFGVRLEALYIRKGGKGDLAGTIDLGGGNVFDFTGEVTITLDYFELPLLAVVSFPAGPSGSFEIFAGPAVAFKTNAEGEIELAAEGQTASEKTDIGDEIKGTDVGGVIGAAFVFELARVNLFFDARWTYGFTRIDDTPEDLDIKNSALAFVAGMAFPLAGK